MLEQLEQNLGCCKRQHSGLVVGWLGYEHKHGWKGESEFVAEADGLARRVGDRVGGSAEPLLPVTPGQGQ